MVRGANTWDPAAAAIRPVLSGPMTTDDARAWADGFRVLPAALPTGTPFKLLYDMGGFAPADLAARKATREVVPRAIAAHGMRPAVHAYTS